MNKEIYGTICVTAGMVAGALLYRAKTIKYVKKVNQKLDEGIKEVESTSKVVAESTKRIHQLSAENLDLKQENERLKSKVSHFKHCKKIETAVYYPCEEFRNLVARSCL